MTSLTRDVWYLDKPKGPYFSSFEGLGQYTDVKETIIYNHLGAFDKKYYQLKRQQEQLLAQKKDTEEKLNVIALMIDKIKKDIIEADYSTDLEMLNREISQISRAYRRGIRPEYNGVIVPSIQIAQNGTNLSFLTFQPIITTFAIAFSGKMLYKVNRERRI